MDKEYVPISIRLPRELYEKILKRAENERRSISNFVVVILEEYSDYDGVFKKKD